jgi:TldD protein
MMPVLRRALDRFSGRGLQLGQARWVEVQLEWLALRNGQVTVCNRTLSRGLGVRVLAGGWGYAGSSNWEQPEAVVDQAIALAQAAAPHAYKEIGLGSAPPALGEWKSPCEIDPFTVPMDEKLDWLRSATEAMGDVSVASAGTMSLKRITHFVSTEGSDWSQEQIVTGVSIGATAVKDGRVQIRTWPKSDDGNVGGRGWEYVLGHDIQGQAPVLAEEANALLSAPKIPSGEHDIILDGAQLSLQIHESCGHPVEGDRVLGEEMSLAGGSFLQPAQVGERYGSDIVDLYAEATTTGAAGSFGWDDEGSPATQVPLVEKGIFRGWLTGRESAHRLGSAPAAAMRANSWSGIPIVRMVNVNLAPGNAGDLKTLIASTERGYLLSRNRAWSIDQLRLNFQFGCEAAYEIVDGELKGLCRDPIYTGKTPSFWQSCDAICSESEWEQWGWAFCGKGDPMQLIHVSHGCAPARFRKVRIL